MEIKDVKTKTIQFTLNWRDGFSYFGGFTAPSLGFKQISDKKMLPFLSWTIRNDEKHLVWENILENLELKNNI